MLSPAVARASGWNCTPHIGYSWEDSIASGILSDDQPVTLNPGANLLDRLVMVSIGEKLCLSGYGCHGRTGSEVDGMSWYTARFLLLVADSGVGMLGRDILIKGSAESYID